MIVGFQARGTLGRALVDGAREIHLWGESINVAAKIHTIGGLSAHADQLGLYRWYSGFKNKPKLILVHGEIQAMASFSQYLDKHKIPDYQVAKYADEINLLD